MAESQPPSPAMATSSEAAPVESTQADSPTISGKTVVESPQPQETQARAPPRGAAWFSTGGGARPHREPPGPPFPSVIVRSDKVAGVVQAANYWREKYPMYYHNFFPQCGWTIHDLWDNADIHLESPGFLAEVLKFITQDNVYRAAEYAKAWSQIHQHTGQFVALSGKVNADYDWNDHLAIVDKVFTNGETDEYPHQFLWHVLVIIRRSMWVVAQKQKEADAAAGAQHGNVSAGTESNEAERNVEPTAEKSAIAAEVKPSEPAPALGGRPYNTQIPATPATTFVNPNTGGPVPRGPSFAPSHPAHGYPNQPMIYPMNESIATMSSYIEGQIRNPKKGSRSRSGSHNHPAQMHSWADNMRVPSGQHTRHPSGHIPAAQGGRYLPPAPMGPGPMKSPHPMTAFPHSGSMTSPQMHPGQLHYPSMFPPGVMPPQGAPFAPQSMDPAYQPYMPQGPGPQGMAFGDMSNGMPYPPMRGMDTRQGMMRHGSQTKSSALFNPYGAERPDKADFANVPLPHNGKKGGRSSFSNNTGRNRKFSAASQNRGQPGLYNPERVDDMRRESGVRDPPYTRAQIFEDPEIVNNRESGCHERWIGPKNDKVFELFVGNLPPRATEGDLMALFKQQANINPTRVTSNPMSGTLGAHTFVRFSSVNEARSCLSVNGASLRENNISVKVPRKYWTLKDAPTLTRDPRIQGMGTQGHGPMPPHGPQNNSHSATASTRPVQYSPQDARSDLSRVDGQERHDPNVHRGSPEMRKSKNRTASAGSKASRDNKPSEEQDHGSVAKLETVLERVHLNETAGDKAGKQLENVKEHADATNLEQAVASSSTYKPDAVDISETTRLPEADDKGAQHVEGRSDSVALPSHAEAWSDSQSPNMAESKSTTPAPPTGTSTIVPPPSNAEKSVKNVAKAQDSQDKPVESTQVGEKKLEGADPGTVEDAPCDEEEKNDLSFHSAQESQPDTDNQERKDESKPSVKMSPTVDMSSASDPARIQEAVTEHDDEKSVASETETLVPQQDKTSQSVSAPENPSSDTIKKHGVKQTESLFPFAKPNKNKAKKERQAKKKDKKKEKEKGKPEKIDQVTTNSAEAVGTQPKPDHSDPTDQPPNHTTVEGSKNTNLEKVQKDDNEKEAKALESVKKGTAVDVGEVTEQTEPQQSTVVQEAKEHSHGSSATIVPSPEVAKAASQAKSSSSSGPATTSSLDEGEMPKSKNSKTALDKIAVPNMNLLKSKASSSGTSSSRGTAEPASAEVANLTEFLKGASINSDTMKGSRKDNAHDSGSVASSSTLRGMSPPPMSASPTTADFFTPLQTPVALTAPSSDAPKKKRKSKKKKAVQKPTDAPTDAPADVSEPRPTQEAAQEPFHDQIANVDSAKLGTSSGYHALRNLSELKEVAPSEDEHPRSLIQQVHTYMREKAATYARMSDNAFKEEDRRPAQKMTPMEMQTLVDGERALEAEFLLNQDAPGKAGSPPFFTS